MKPMMTICPSCGGLHLLGTRHCRPSRMPKRETVANGIRKTYKWRTKSEQVRERDRYLCRVCLTNEYNTVQQYTSERISVHHIVPLAEAPDQGFNNDNLISVCVYHHKLAESGKIPRLLLKQLAASTPAPRRSVF